MFQESQTLCFIDLVHRYNECMATVRRLPAVDHNFQLVITKVYEDGDQDLLEDEDESEIRDSPDFDADLMIPITFM